MSTFSYVIFFPGTLEMLFQTLRNICPEFFISKDLGNDLSLSFKMNNNSRGRIRSYYDNCTQIHRFINTSEQKGIETDYTECFFRSPENYFLKINHPNFVRTLQSILELVFDLTALTPFPDNL